MKNHVKIYLEYYNYQPGDFIACKVCEAEAVDIHHIEARGMGGSKEMDRIDNLIALCRPCHEKYGDRKQFKDFLYDKLL
jgi:hypothetical protein